MKFLNVSVTIALSLAVAGCSSTVKKQASEKSLPFTKGVSSVSPSGAKGTCVTSKDKWVGLSWKKLNDYANHCVQSEKWSTVEALGHLMAEKFYHSPWGAYYLSIVHEQYKEYPKALWYSELSISKSKQDLGLLYYQRGRVLVQLKEPSEAHKVFEHALSLDNSLWDAHLYLGRQAYMDGDFSKVVRHLEPVYNENLFDTVEPFHIFAKALESKKSWEMALAVLDRGIRSHQGNLELRLQKAKIQEEDLRDLRSALQTYEEILKLQNNSKLGKSASLSVRDKIDRIRKNLEEVEKEQRVPASQESKA